MMDLTPLDVRNKRGDFRRIMRGFDPAEVDTFLELVAERMEALVKENLTLKERSARLQDQVREQVDREKAIQDALVTAQELRKDISGQAQREAELMKREAEAEIERMLLDAEQRAEELRATAVELERRRRRFLQAYRHYLERELDDVSRESGRRPLEDAPLELELTPAFQAPAGGHLDADASEDADRGMAERETEADGRVDEAEATGSATSAEAATEPARPDPAADGATAVTVDAAVEPRPDALTEGRGPSDELSHAPAPDEPAESSDGGPVSVEALAPESAEGPSVDRAEAEDVSTDDGTWSGPVRLPTEVASERSGEADGF